MWGKEKLTGSYLFWKSLQCSQVEGGKEKKSKLYNPWCLVLVLTLVLLVLALCFFSLRYLWSPSLGKVRTKHVLAVGPVLGLIATACRRRRVRVPAQSDERHTAAKPSRFHQREENNSPVRATGVSVCGGNHTKSQRRLSAVCIVFWEIKRSVGYREKKGQPVFCCARLWPSDV